MQAWTPPAPTTTMHACLSGKWGQGWESHTWLASASPHLLLLAPPLQNSASMHRWLIRLQRVWHTLLAYSIGIFKQLHCVPPHQDRHHINDPSLCSPIAWISPTLPTSSASTSNVEGWLSLSSRCRVGPAIPPAATHCCANAPLDSTKREARPRGGPKRAGSSPTLSSRDTWGGGEARWEVKWREWLKKVL